MTVDVPMPLAKSQFQPVIVPEDDDADELKTVGVWLQAEVDEKEAGFRR